MTEEFELKYQGLIDGDKVNETDYLLGGDNNYDIPENINNEDYEYNQGKLKRTRNGCVLYACAASLGYTMNYKFSTEELLEIIALAEKSYGWREDYGMWISKGVDCVRHWWNAKYPNRKIKTYRMVLGDDNFLAALRANYRIVVGYRTCTPYYKDSQDDGIVDGTKFGPFKGGHCVTSKFNTAGTIRKGKNTLIVDNYTGTKKYNTYINNNIVKLKKSGTFFQSAFIFVKEETMKDEIRKNIDLEGAKIAFDLGIFNGNEPRKNVSRQETATMTIRGMEKVIELFNRIHKTDYKISDLKK